MTNRTRSSNQLVYAASFATTKQHAFNSNVLITSSPAILSNRSYSKSIITGNSGGSNDTTNNKNNTPRNLSGGGDKYSGGGKDGNGSLSCPRCGNPKCVSVDLAGKLT